jgi:hypothetical protein
MSVTQSLRQPARTTHDEDDSATYLPTPEEIREACQEIQAGWSEADQRRRATGQSRRERTPCVSARRYARLAIDVNDRDDWAA